MIFTVEQDYVYLWSAQQTDPVTNDRFDHKFHSNT